ncbi:hypothetical protein BV20DRAFT_244386 [Pilatotrama ljubarskyi]|nr:hypothetical protein BV20DRAFT_244494 [Pilatotrama ljubarskyi]KAI0362960.1 hypothetical protein BV20DRAFT_244386 [Pilatotrama ljubarskyi]
MSSCLSRTCSVAVWQKSRLFFRCCSRVKSSRSLRRSRRLRGSLRSTSTRAVEYGGIAVLDYGPLVGPLTVLSEWNSALDLLLTSDPRGVWLMCTAFSSHTPLLWLCTSFARRFRRHVRHVLGD